MRTTLTLDDQLAERLKQAASREGKPFKAVINETLRAGLGLIDKPRLKSKSPALRTFRSRLKIGIDETKLNQLSGELEIESFLGNSLRAARRK